MTLPEKIQEEIKTKVYFIRQDIEDISEYLSRELTEGGSDEEQKEILKENIKEQLTEGIRNQL